MERVVALKGGHTFKADVEAVEKVPKQILRRDAEKK
jgi:hypothetical protein